MIHQTDTESPETPAEAESLVGIASTDLLAVFECCQCGEKTKQVRRSRFGIGNLCLECKAEEDSSNRWW